MEEFEKLYVKYLKDVYRFLLKLSGNPDVAEELTQDTFAIAFENLEKFRGTCKVSVWLCQIAKHRYYAWYKKNRQTMQELTPQMEAEECSFGRTVEEEVIDHTEGRRIHQILHGIPEPYKEVFMLRVMGELPYRDISQLFGKSESWARVTYYRAKSMIIERLGGEEHDEM